MSIDLNMLNNKQQQVTFICFLHTIRLFSLSSITFKAMTKSSVTKLTIKRVQMCNMNVVSKLAHTSRAFMV